MEKMYKPQEVAEILGFTHSTVLSYIHSGKIKSVKVFGSNRVKESDLQDIIKERNLEKQEQ